MNLVDGLRRRGVGGWSKRTGRLVYGVAMALSLCSAVSMAQDAASDIDAPTAGAPSSLVQAWLAFPDAKAIAPPYAYIRADDSAEFLEGQQEDLFKEYDELRFRFKTGGYDGYVQALDAWRAALVARDVPRVPGDWSASYLLAHPHRVPPMERVVAIGACQAPDTVNVWSPDGFERVAWHSGQRLTDLYDRLPSLRKSTTARVAVVDPYGKVDYYGTQAWNFADGELSPGASVIGSFPLDGEVFGWMQKAMADYVARTASGVDCREQKFQGGDTGARAGQ